MEPGFLVAGGFSRPPSCSIFEKRSNFSPLRMDIPPPSTTEQPKTGNCSKTREGTCCWLSCAALGGEGALLHGGGSAVFHRKGSPSSVLSLPPPKTPQCWRQGFCSQLLLLPTLAPCCGRGRWFPFFAVSAQSTAGLSASKRWGAESCRCHGNNACTEQQRA